MSRARSGQTLTRRQQFAAVIVAALLVGGIVAPYAYGLTADSDGTVAVVELDGVIVGPVGEQIEQQLREVRQDPSVEAVVLKVNSPGGAPVPSERIYTAVQRTAEEMPVIASVQTYGASGAYYGMLPADEIFVMPTSQVGSVGLAAGAPGPTPPVRGPSGPDKRGANPIEGWAMQQTLADTFVETVMQNRGDRIRVSREEVEHADVYLGTEAVQNGFADEVGSLEAAIDTAAELAGLDDYDVQRHELDLEQQTVLLQTDQGVVLLEEGNPNYAQVRTPQFLMVYEGAIPHVDTVEEFAEADVNATGGESA